MNDRGRQGSTWDDESPSVAPSDSEWDDWGSDATDDVAAETSFGGGVDRTASNAPRRGRRQQRSSTVSSRDRFAGNDDLDYEDLGQDEADGEADGTYGGFDDSDDAGRQELQGRRARKRSRNEASDDDDDEYLAPPVKRGRGCLVGLAGIACTVGLFVWGGIWLRQQMDPPGPPGSAIEIRVPSGTTTARVGEILAEQKIITNSQLFGIYARVKGRTQLQAGRYVLPTNMSFDEALDALEKGPAIADQQKVTIPEGLRLTQIAERIGKLPERSEEEFLRLALAGTVRSRFEPSDSKNLEGLLFPETYKFNIDDDETEILSRMVDTFDQVATEVGIQNAEDLVGVSPYDAIIVASLVEREAKLDVERPMVARVIYNRLLKAKMALQIDATIVYAQGGITRVLNEDLKKDGPFNTYTRKGLPPTPIAMPGRKSLEAALNPTEGDWLYYVVTGADGSSSFANTFKEHKANIKLAQERGVRE
jgi:UPF0755 protein